MPNATTRKRTTTKRTTTKRAAGAAGLDLRALNRALLARQHLLTPSTGSALDVIERLVGLQAQAARPPFVGLWTRLASFQRDDLAKLIKTGDVVKVMAMRVTLHLMRRDDYRALWPALAPLLAKAVLGLGARAKGIDVDEIAALTRAHLAKGPATFDEIRAALKAAYPKLDERAMGYAARTSLPLRFLPVGHDAGAEGARWCFAPDTCVALVEEKPGAFAGDVDAATRALVVRYLAAFGPATVADAQAWCGLRTLKPAFEALRDAGELEVVHGDDGRALFDVRGAPRPDGDVAAPVRFVADFDNLVLGHADRRRIVADEHRKLLVTKNLLVKATFLVDGFVAGTWRPEVKRAKKGDAATLVVEPFDTKLVPKAARAALEEEGERLLAFVEPDARDRTVAFTG